MDLIACDGWIALRIADAYAQLNGGSRIGLYTNSVSATPAHVVGDFTPASYAGYNYVDLNGLWTTPAQVVSGQWVTTTPTINFVAPGSGSVVLYGAYIWQSASNYLMVFMPFTAPITLSANDPDLQVQVAYDLWARSLLP